MKTRKNKKTIYEIIWCEDKKMRFKQIGCIDNKKIITGSLPDLVYDFYEKLISCQYPVVILAHKEPNKDGTGLIKYCRAEPV